MICGDDTQRELDYVCSIESGHETTSGTQPVQVAGRRSNPTFMADARHLDLHCCRSVHGSLRENVLPLGDPHDP